MLKYAKLHILLGILASPQARGKLALATYAKAFAVISLTLQRHEPNHLLLLLVILTQ